MLMFSLYVVCFIYHLLYCYLFSKIILKEKFIITKKIIFISLMLAIPLCFNFHYNNTPLKPFVSHILFFIVIKSVYNKMIVKTLSGLLVSFAIVSISELIFAFIFVYGLNIPQEFLNDTICGIIFTNLGIMAIVMIIMNIQKVKSTIDHILLGFSNDKLIRTLLLVILCLSIATFMIYQNFYKDMSFTYLILINLFFIGVYVFIFGFFIEKTNNNKLTIKYDHLYDYSKTSEQELIRRSKRQHEYKNQLVIIKSMIEEKDDETVNYINCLLNEETKSNDLKWLDKLANIPLGGLKGLLYYKINEMVAKKIKINLSVSESLSKKTLWSTYKDNPQDISKIIGVYLDNAIEAADLSEEKIVEIQIYLENKDIVICIANTFTGIIDEDKLDKEGYSSKGKGRGYGLPLVKDLLSKHNELEQKREIMDNYYIQNLIIKQKNDI